MIRSHHARIFSEMMVEHRIKLVDSLVGGNLDYPMYRQIVGAINGIDDALRLSEEADGIISGGMNAA